MYFFSNSAHILKITMTALFSLILHLLLEYKIKIYLKTASKSYVCGCTVKLKFYLTRTELQHKMFEI